jgi:tetratricopeptide (TPR) repeat protein
MAYRARAALFGRSNIAEALEPALCAIELDPSDVLPAGIIGFAWRMGGRPDLAVRWLQKSTRRGQRPGMNAAAIGDAYAELGDDRAAEKAYRQQFEFWPDIPDAHVGLSWLWLRREEFERAGKECGEAVRRYPTHPYARQMLALFAFCSRDFAAAETHYRGLIQTDRRGGGDFYGGISNLSALGFLLLQKGAEDGRSLLNEALRSSDKALVSAPQNREILYDIAGINAALGEHARSLEVLKRAVLAGWTDYRALSIDPRFDSLRQEMDFENILTGLASRVAQMRGQLPAQEQAQLNQNEKNNDTRN